MKYHYYCRHFEFACGSKVLQCKELGNFVEVDHPSWSNVIKTDIVKVAGIYALVCLVEKGNAIEKCRWHEFAFSKDKAMLKVHRDLNFQS